MNEIHDNEKWPNDIAMAFVIVVLAIIALPLMLAMRAYILIERKMGKSK